MITVNGRLLARCFYCNDLATTDDHIIPACNGGAWNNWNYVDSCHSCNNKRGNMPIEEFMRIEGKDGPVPIGMTRARMMDFLEDHGARGGNLELFTCAYCGCKNHKYKKPGDQPTRFCDRRCRNRYNRKRKKGAIAA